MDTHDHEPNVSLRVKNILEKIESYKSKRNHDLPVSHYEPSQNNNEDMMIDHFKCIIHDLSQRLKSFEEENEKLRLDHDNLKADITHLKNESEKKEEYVQSLMQEISKLKESLKNVQISPTFKNTPSPLTPTLTESIVSVFPPSAPRSLRKRKSQIMDGKNTPLRGNLDSLRKVSSRNLEIEFKLDESIPFELNNPDHHYDDDSGDTKGIDTMDQTLTNSVEDIPQNLSNGDSPKTKSVTDHQPQTMNDESSEINEDTDGNKELDINEEIKLTEQPVHPMKQDILFKPNQWAPIPVLTPAKKTSTLRPIKTPTTRIPTKISSSRVPTETSSTNTPSNSVTPKTFSTTSKTPSNIPPLKTPSNIPPLKTPSNIPPSKRTSSVPVMIPKDPAEPLTHDVRLNTPNHTSFQPLSIPMPTSSTSIQPPMTFLTPTQHNSTPQLNSTPNQNHPINNTHIEPHDISTPKDNGKPQNTDSPSFFSRLFSRSKSENKKEMKFNNVKRLDSFYYNKELDMWVERGKEREYAEKKRPPPPPPKSKKI